jgi:exodeoxyribonuclease VII small subunit
MKRKESDADLATPAASFESMMKRLEELVHHMERGDLSLEESIRSFEEGIKLVKQCTAVLGEAEKRIHRLADEGVAAAGTRAATETEEERGADELPF